MKIIFSSIYKQMKSSVSIWWLLRPKIKRYWGGKLIYIGTIGWYIIIDFRNINNIYDFVRALANER